MFPIVLMSVLPAPVLKHPQLLLVLFYFPILLGFYYIKLGKRPRLGVIFGHLDQGYLLRRLRLRTLRNRSSGLSHRRVWLQNQPQGGGEQTRRVGRLRVGMKLQQVVDRQLAVAVHRGGDEIGRRLGLGDGGRGEAPAHSSPRHTWTSSPRGRSGPFSWSSTTLG